MPAEITISRRDRHFSGRAIRAAAGKTLADKQMMGFTCPYIDQFELALKWTMECVLGKRDFKNVLNLAIRHREY